MLKKGQAIPLEISHIAFGGKGLAKPDGFAVFVDKAVPGDVVQALITRKKKNYAEARVLELLTASPDRIDTAMSLQRLLRWLQVAIPGL